MKTKETSQRKGMPKKAMEVLGTSKSGETYVFPRDELFKQYGHVVMGFASDLRGTETIADLEKVKKSYLRWNRKQEHQLPSAIITKAIDRLWRQRQFLLNTEDQGETSEKWEEDSAEEVVQLMKERGVKRSELVRALDPDKLCPIGDYAQGYAAEKLRTFMTGYYLLSQGKAPACAIDQMYKLIYDQAYFMTMQEASCLWSNSQKSMNRMLERYRLRFTSAVRTGFLDMIVKGNGDSFDKLATMERTVFWGYFGGGEHFLSYLFQSDDEELTEMLDRMIQAFIT